jgi:hypothetical protein
MMRAKRYTKSGGSKMKIAKPCKKCGQYYPGDCLEFGCKSDLCLCDGCQSYFAQLEYEELAREE